MKEAFRKIKNELNNVNKYKKYESYFFNGKNINNFITTDKTLNYIVEGFKRLKDYIGENPSQIDLMVLTKIKIVFRKFKIEDLFS